MDPKNHMERGLEQVLAGVERPARYIGGEAGLVVKDPERVRLTLALAFPEVYEIAMSHLGLKVLYEALAPRPEVAAERVFCPWMDLMDRMAETGRGPWSLETGRPLGDFDVIGFSLQYELTYTNVLHMLSLAGVPVRREDRGPEHPLVIAGGPSLANPEPMADFLDLAVIGEAEELIHELVDLFIRAKDEVWPRGRLWQEAAKLEGVYAPALYQPEYRDGRLAGMRSLPGAPEKVRRRVLADLAAQPPALNRVVPSVKPVHDRLGLEISRGCTRGCRFCQAGYFYRPAREREPGQVLTAALEAVAASGLEELALLSLSAGDYSCITELTTALMDALESRKVSLSLPSLRVDSLSDELIAQVKRVRKTGFTLAPEAGSQKMRDRINKDLAEEAIIDTARRVYGLGWNLVKLYFMVGLPGEDDEDILAIGRLAGQVADQARRVRGKKPVVNASLGVFVPKAHTPFQRDAQVNFSEARRRLDLAKSGITHPRVRSKWHEPRLAVLEGVISRGDRRVGAVIERAAAAGCRFDGWSEHTDYEAWLAALQAEGFTPDDWLRAREPEEVLPWDHIDLGVDPAYLAAERRKAELGERTGDCRRGDCQGCGVCDFETLEPRLASGGELAAPAPPTPPEERITYRFRLEKTGPARHLGHLETMKQIERAWRRAGVELAYSQGFHPHALVKAASALPLGVESLVEVLVVTVLGGGHPDELAERVNAVLPQGLAVADGRLARPGEKLTEPVEVTYRILPAESLDPEAVAAFQRARTWPWLRVTPKGERTIDLKEAVKDLALEDGVLTITVGKAGGRPKPSEVLTSLFGASPRAAEAARALKTGATW